MPDSPTADTEPAGMTQLEAAIVDAIERNEFVLHYQPIVSLRTGEVEAYEALVRWARPGAGLLQPADFIPAAEGSDLICRVDRWVISRAARQLAEWNQLTGDRRLVLAVNVSGRHINALQVRDDVLAALDDNEIDARQLVLEITETVLVDEGLAMEHLRTLHRLGIGFSLDDVGIGYNSVDQLTRLPLDSIKIDRTYVSADAPSSRQTLRDLVEAAHSLGLAVCGEGVEREDQLSRLRALGAETVQGFLLGCPTTAAAVRSGLAADAC